MTRRAGAFARRRSRRRDGPVFETTPRIDPDQPVEDRVVAHHHRTDSDPIGRSRRDTNDYGGPRLASNIGPYPTTNPRKAPTQAIPATTARAVVRSGRKIATIRAPAATVIAR